MRLAAQHAVNAEIPSSSVDAREAGGSGAQRPLFSQESPRYSEITFETLQGLWERFPEHSKVRERKHSGRDD